MNKFIAIILEDKCFCEYIKKISRYKFLTKLLYISLFDTRAYVSPKEGESNLSNWQ